VRRPESTYVRLLPVIALGLVLAAAVSGRAWPSLVFPALGVLFAAGGAAAAGHLDAAGSGRAYLRRAVAALLVPFWVFGATVVAVMTLEGWRWDVMAGSAPLTWSTAWRWVLPLTDPPVSTEGLGLTGSLWFVRTWLWLVLLTPPLLWSSRRWPLRVMALPLSTMVLAAVGVVNPTGSTADVVLGVCGYTGCWLVGSAHHDGRVRRVPTEVALAVGAVLAAAGVGLALWQQPVYGTASPDANPAAATLFSLGGVLVLLRIEPWMRWLDGVRGLRPVASLVHGHTLTAVLWVDVVVALTPPALAATPLARFHTATVQGGLLQYAATGVLLLAAVASLGRLDDLAAGRPPRFLRRRRRVDPAPDAAPEVGPERGRAVGPGALARGPRMAGPFGSTGGPLQEPVRGPAVDHPLGRDPALDRPLATVALPVELAGGVRVGVDGELAAQVDGEGEQPQRRIQPLGPGVDLHRGAVLDARGEHRLGVEGALRPRPLASSLPLLAGDQQPAGAVPEDVGVRVRDRGQHPLGHRRGVRAQVGVHAGDDDVQPPEQLVGLVEAAVDVDVALDAGEDPEGGELLVERGDDVELSLQPLGGQPVGDGQPR
jgi:hypothetical protein